MASRPDEPARLAHAWNERVEANRAQVERCREIPESSDFYAPVSDHFRVDPDRADDPVLEALRRRTRPDDVWLDIGAGAGRYALPLARGMRRLVAIEPSPAMREGLMDGMAEHGIDNIELVAERWPVGVAAPIGDVAFIAHVGYDVAPIGPFLDAMDAAAGRSCVGVLMEAAPASYAYPFWPPIHGEERAPLPAMPELLDLLRARGATPTVEWLPPQVRQWPDGETLISMLRHQLWIEPDGPSDAKLREEVARRIEHGPDGASLRSNVNRIGIVEWVPPRISGSPTDG